MQEPPGLEGKTTRPALIAAVGLLAAFAFWKVGPPPIPGQEPSGSPSPFSDSTPPRATTPRGAPTPSLASTPSASSLPSPGEAGGFADGSGVGQRTAPPSLAPAVPSKRAADGRLSMLVYGDEQAMGPDGGWAAAAASVLQDRLRVARAPWTGVQVDLELFARPDLTAMDVLVDLRARTDLPELVLVAVGWADGGPGDREVVPVAVDPERRWWLEELAGLHAHRDIDEERGFYVRSEDRPALSPLRHLEYLDAVGRWGRGHHIAVLYLEQPIHQPHGERRFFASTAMRPQPWVSLVYGLEQQAEPDRLVGEVPPRLSRAGDALVGRFVGTGLVQAVISGR